MLALFYSSPGYQTRWIFLLPQYSSSYSFLRSINTCASVSGLHMHVCTWAHIAGSLQTLLFIDTVQIYSSDSCMLRMWYMQYWWYFVNTSNFKTVICIQLLKYAVYMSAFILVITLCLVVHFCGETAFQTMGISKCFGCFMISQYCINQQFGSKHI